MKKEEKLSHYRELLAAATGEGGKVYSAIVLVCGFAFALGLCFVLRPHFEYQGNLGVTSWISANKYPKQQEMFYYATSLFFVPLFTALVWGSWLLCSIMVSHLTRLPSQQVLKKYAFTYLPFILILRKIGTPSFSATLLTPLILFFAAASLP